jgi:hypothetical protein
MGAMHAGFYVFLGKTGLFDVVGNPLGKAIVICGFPSARFLVSLILAVLVSSAMAGGMLWRQTRSLKLALTVIPVAVAIYLAGIAVEWTPEQWAAYIEETVRWYHHMRS